MQTSSKKTTASSRSTTSKSSTASMSTAKTRTTSGTSTTGEFGDKQILQDTLMSQKHMTDAYNTFAGECVSPQLRSTMLTILNDEHKIQADIFTSMQTNGWYQTENATKAKIQQTKTKVSSS